MQYGFPIKPKESLLIIKNLTAVLSKFLFIIS